MESKKIDEFLKQVDIKFADQTPNGPNDPRRLTVGLSDVSTDQWFSIFTWWFCFMYFYTHSLRDDNWRQPEHPWIKWDNDVSYDYSSWERFSRDISCSIIGRMLSKPP